MFKSSFYELIEPLIIKIRVFTAKA